MRVQILAAVGLLAGLTGYSAQAQQPGPAQATVTTVPANLNITPKRVTFDKNRRSATVYIYNQGGQAGTFDIALVDRVMLPSGEIMAASDAANNPEAKPIAGQLKSAKDVVLVSPRRVTLPPGQGQTVRLRVASVPPGATGEFRTHLTVTTIPPADAGLSAEAAAAADPNNLVFAITSVFGISIPVIVRFTDPEVQAAIENARVEYAEMSTDGRAPKRTPVISFDVVRRGTSSLFGNIEVRVQGQKGGEPLGIARGLGVYPEISRRHVKIPLARDPGRQRLEITFTDDDTSPGKLLAKMDL
ncbi:hypothetical protein [Phenylobacterium sp.]|jgi:hypothetical protein|uniref:hypothetical protein n=1 Tax=Phenylobacterium sp. TaxID=1871053 RepID=UPI002F937009